MFWYIDIGSSPTISINTRQQHENSLISECTKCENYVISHIKCECLICFEWMNEMNEKVNFICDFISLNIQMYLYTVLLWQKFTQHCNQHTLIARFHLGMRCSLRVENCLDQMKTDQRTNWFFRAANGCLSSFLLVTCFHLTNFCFYCARRVNDQSPPAPLNKMNDEKHKWRKCL